MEESVVFEPVVQKDANDCGIACLAMYLGFSYADVRKAAGRRLGKEGMTIAAILATAKKLGKPLSLSIDFDSEDFGVVSLSRPKKRGGGHVVVFLRGMVWNPAAGQLWSSLNTYCHDRGFVLDGIMKRSTHG